MAHCLKYTNRGRKWRIRRVLTNWRVEQIFGKWNLMYRKENCKVVWNRPRFTLKTTVDWFENNNKHKTTWFYHAPKILLLIILGLSWGIMCHFGQDLKYVDYTNETNRPPSHQGERSISLWPESDFPALQHSVNKGYAGKFSNYWKLGEVIHVLQDLYLGVDYRKASACCHIGSWPFILDLKH